VFEDIDAPTGHTFLPHCWVCGHKFGPNLLEERHHIIPEAYGGTNGPQVSLCSDHHSALHEVGLRIYADKPYFDLLSRKEAQDRRLVYLATIACNARLLTENDPNKRQVVVVTLDGPHKQMLLALKTVLAKKSMPRIMELALECLYDRHFLKRP
jgi:hypothetical protein